MAEPTQATVGECVFRILRDEILSAGPGLTPSSDLVEAGLDSLALTQLMLSIEEQIGVWLDESLLTPENLKTAETLAALVAGQLGKP